MLQKDFSGLKELGGGCLSALVFIARSCLLFHMHYFVPPQTALEADQNYLK